MKGPDKNQMHPDDIRNLFIFFALSILVYFGWKFFVMDPNLEAANKARMAQMELAKIEQPVDALGTQQGQVKERKDVISATSAERIKIKNGRVSGSILLQGARIDDITLSEYFKTKEQQENVAVLSPNGSEFPRYVEHGWISADKNIQVPDSKTRWSADSSILSADRPVTLYWQNPQGIRFEREFSIDENYMITVKQNVINNSGRKVTLHPYALVSQQGIPPDYQGVWVSHEGFVGYAGGYERASYKAVRKEGSKAVQADDGWFGITDKYWLTALVPPQGENVKYSMKYSGPPPAKGQKDTGRYQADYTAAALVLEPGKSGEVQSHVFSGAKKVLLLKEYDKTLNIPSFDLAVDFGWFWPLGIPFFYILHYMGQLTGNMGIAIILLTVCIRGGVFPLTNVSYKSFGKMKKVAPQTAELRKKYGDDKQKLQEELMKMYQREGVNPMAGCLPMLIQIPIFFALYKVIFVTIEIRHAPFFGWIQDLSLPDPTSIFNLFGIIPWDPPAALMVGVWPCLMLVGMLIQKKLNPPPQDPLQRDMATYFPFVITYMLSRFASGLVIYWTFSAYIGIIQQIIIMRNMGVPIHLFGETEEEKELDEAIEKGPAVHPLVGMAEDEVEDALFGDDDGAPPPKIKPRKNKKKKK